MIDQYRFLITCGAEPNIQTFTVWAFTLSEALHIAEVMKHGEISLPAITKIEKVKHHHEMSQSL